MMLLQLLFFFGGTDTLRNLIFHHLENLTAFPDSCDKEEDRRQLVRMNATDYHFVAWSRLFCVPNATGGWMASPLASIIICVRSCKKRRHEIFVKMHGTPTTVIGEIG
jgi:hypothetical protein